MYTLKCESRLSQGNGGDTNDASELAAFTKKLRNYIQRRTLFIYSLIYVLSKA